MPVVLHPRLCVALAAAFLLTTALPVAAVMPGAGANAAPAATPAYTEAELRLIHEEAAATGGMTFTFYIAASDEQNVLQDTWQQLQQRAGGSLKQLPGMEPRQQQAFALPAAVREQLRLLTPGERSPVFALDKRNWALVELEAVDNATAVPGFESLRAALPKLIASGAIPEPRRLATDAALVQRRLMNKAITTAEFDRLPPGFDIDMPLSVGLTLLQRALILDDAAMVSATLTRAANTNLCLSRSCPLQLALRSKTAPARHVSALLAAGARPDQVAVPGEDTALTLATALGQLESARALLAAGANRNGDGGPNTPLGVAAFKGYREIGQLLLDKGADPLHRKPAPGGFSTPMANALASGNAATVSWLRAATRKQAAARKAHRWSLWIEQDGEKVPLVNNRLHLQRKPFTLHVRLPAGSELRLEAATSAKLFDEYLAGDMAAPLYQLKRRHAELHDGSAATLLVSDFAARTADPARHGGLQAWAMAADRKDFKRVDKTPQGPVLVREITALVLDERSGRTEVALEKTRLREIALLVGTGVDYSTETGDLINARRLRLVFDR
ncbi:MAG: ankyrin repeat domain-containing protein [Pseudomonadota bacterium]